MNRVRPFPERRRPGVWMVASRSEDMSIVRLDLDVLDERLKREVPGPRCCIFLGEGPHVRNADGVGRCLNGQICIVVIDEIWVQFWEEAGVNGTGEI